jgi:hypothetical protein
LTGLEEVDGGGGCCLAGLGEVEGGGGCCLAAFSFGESDI